MIDLMPFCARSHLNRSYFEKPHSRGDWTYATNGHIAIRVPRREDVPDNPEAPDVEAKVFAKYPEMPPMVPLPSFDFSSAEKPCVICVGHGHPGRQHDCPSCQCPCEDCDGTGLTLIDVSADLGGVPFDAEYVRLLSKLPGVMIPATLVIGCPMAFSFEGGSGVLMPLISEHDTHLTATPA